MNLDEQQNHGQENEPAIEDGCEKPASEPIEEETDNTAQPSEVVTEPVALPIDGQDATPQEPEKKTTVTLGVFASVICVVVAVTVLLTYTLTSAFTRAKYTEALQEKQDKIDLLEQASEFEKLALISAMLEKYSYYADGMSEEAMIEAALKAYVAATGDRYATYYTKEEYEALNSSTTEYAGIGAATIQSELTYNGTKYYGFTIDYFYKDSPAQQSGLRKDDFIYGIKVEGVYQTVEALGGYDKALEMIRGASGTKVELLVLREVAEGVRQSLSFTITRALITDPSVFYDKRDGDDTTALVSIRRFDLDTPTLFKNTVNKLLGEGVEHFVFDVRDNPGGDLLSIKAVLSYFLQEGDLVLKSIDKDGAVAKSYVVEPMSHTDEYASCNVTAEEIGMYADLDMVVLCNENTASAAEVFTATMRDYGMAKIVGTTTFGKGIMQMIFDISAVSNFTGYLKLTTYAYVTKCGETYHEIGISPDEGLEFELSDEAKEYSMYDLPEALDNQLQAAFSQFTP